jgi:hypothetical protein
VEPGVWDGGCADVAMRWDSLQMRAGTVLCGPPRTFACRERPVVQSMAPYEIQGLSRNVAKSSTRRGQSIPKDFNLDLL